MGRVIVVANRLPVVACQRQGKLAFERSSGGLISGLSGMTGPTLWVGWPGPVAEADKGEATRILSEMSYHPVFFSNKLGEMFYEGYCNGALWPLFHSMPMLSKTVEDEYQAFLEANRIFADEVAKVYQEGDIVWIHDYHLVMLPMELRHRLGSILPMSLFLHIPFPHVDVMRLLPNHTAIITSMLQVDLIGFHTTEYANNFVACITRLCGIIPVLGRVSVPALSQSLPSHIIQISAFPMGIDFAKHFSASKDKVIIDKATEVRRHLGVEKIVFSVSRLDYTKGIPQSLTAMRAFLHENPEWVGKITFVLIVVPSRVRVGKYAELKHEIDRMVGEINGEFGTPMWNPVVYMYRLFGWNDLMALYLAADIGLIIPLRDGMNLCAKEFVAIHTDRPGILILSILAGAAKEMIESVIVNPNSVESVVKGIKKALSMTVEEQISRNKSMSQRLEYWNTEYWENSIFKQLEEIKEIQRELDICKLSDTILGNLLRDFGQSRRRKLVLDCDGTLMPYSFELTNSFPDEELLILLNALGNLSNTEVLIISDHSKETLSKWFGHLPIEIAADNGSWSWSRTSGTWRKNNRLSFDQKLKCNVSKIMQDYVLLLPGSLIEEKECAVVFRFCEPYTLDEKQFKDVILSLKSTLVSSLTGLPVIVIDSTNTIEVRVLGSSKGDFFGTFISTIEPSDFLLVMGDETNEEIFAAMSSGYSICVQMTKSRARYNISGHVEARAILQAILAEAQDYNCGTSRVSFSI